MPGMVSKLSGTTKNLTNGLMSDPQKMENLISMVRTVAPLTSAQTVTKVNTYLPLFEKVSTLLGMYSFLSKAQNYRPIETLNVNSPTDMLTALMKNGNMPLGKMLAQPLISNNMEKMMGSMAMNMMKNGGLNDLMKNVNINDMLSAFSQSGNSSQEGSNLDLGSLMETFMPIISSMNSSSSHDDNDEHNNSYSWDYETPQNIELKNESFLPDDEEVDENIESNEKPIAYYSYDDKYDNYEKTKNNRLDNNYKNNKSENYENSVNYYEHRNNYNDRYENSKPIRIKQRKRR